MGGVVCSRHVYPLNPASTYVYTKKEKVHDDAPPVDPLPGEKVSSPVQFKTYAVFRTPDGKMVNLYLDDGETVKTLQEKVRTGKVFYDDDGVQNSSTLPVNFHAPSGKYVVQGMSCEADHLVNRFSMGVCSLCLLLLCVAGVFGYLQMGIGACLLSGVGMLLVIASFVASMLTGFKDFLVSFARDHFTKGL